MKQEEKQVLLQDLCARLSYGVICNTPKGNGHLNSINQTIFDVELGINIDAVRRDTFKLENCKPYLRPMSSMTEEEECEYNSLCDAVPTSHYDFGDIVEDIELYDNFASIDWLNAHYFDYRGLIPKGLAIEAPKEMYEEKTS